MSVRDELTRRFLDEIEVIESEHRERVRKIRRREVAMRLALLAAVVFLALGPVIGLMVAK